jgi:hypothetical protein
MTGILANRWARNDLRSHCFNGLALLCPLLPSVYAAFLEPRLCKHGGQKNLFRRSLPGGLIQMRGAHSRQAWARARGAEWIWPILIVKLG